MKEKKRKKIQAAPTAPLTMVTVQLLSQMYSALENAKEIIQNALPILPPPLEQRALDALTALRLIYEAIDESNHSPGEVPYLLRKIADVVDEMDLWLKKGLN